MEQLKLNAFKEEFPFLSQIKEANSVQRINVKRTSEELLGSSLETTDYGNSAFNQKVETKLWVISGASFEEAKKNKPLEVTNQLSHSGIVGPVGINHEPDAAFVDGDRIANLFLDGAYPDVQFIIYYGMIYDSRANSEEENSNEITIYKPPKRKSIQKFIEELQQEELRKVRTLSSR